MMMKTCSNRWLGLLGAAVIMWSSPGSVVATSDQFDACEAAQDIGNGRCNMGNNIEECGFDGGDCCECTCEDGEYTCGQYVGYACIDPDAACVDDDAVTVDMIENCYDPSSIGNGVCNIQQNNEECAYDGGDCCECTCDPSRYPWYDSGEGCQTGMYGGFACIDPDAPCVDDDIVTAEMMDLCSTGQIGNGTATTATTARNARTMVVIAVSAPVSRTTMATSTTANPETSPASTLKRSAWTTMTIPRSSTSTAAG
ncbi:unnamed protein product [Ectocarpus sp. 12 AP-2014]